MCTFSIEYMTITAFNSVEEGAFNYLEAATNKGFHVICDGFPYGCNGFTNEDLFSTRQSSFINNTKQMSFIDGKNDADRGIMNMNFSLVKEVGIAGIQIWKSIEDIEHAYITKNDMEEFFSQATYKEFIFTSMYQAAQGVERLLKVILELIMYEMKESTEKQRIEKLLMGHNHTAMCDYIEKKENIILKNISKKTLNLLFDFYNRARYHRYKDGQTDILELDLLRNFGGDLDDTNFDQEIKHLYGKSLGQISQTLYNIIYKISLRLNVYVYELPYDSSACYVLNSYYGNDLYSTYKRIALSKKELLWFLINKEQPASKLAMDFPPLPFEKGNINLYVEDLISSGHSNYELFNFINNEYDELVSEDKQKWKERTNTIDSIIGNTDAYFDEGTDE